MTSAEGRPNVILFVADDLGWADLGCYGALGVSTPRIDALAATGTRFWDCHAASSVCTPSRYGILTGRYPWRSPLKSGVLGGADPCIIAAGTRTLARMLAGVGYRTAAFGKWHLGLGWSRKDGTTVSAFGDQFEADMQGEGRDIDYEEPFTNGPLEHGFERFFGIAGSLDMPPYCFLDQDRTVGVPTLEKEPRVTSQRPGLMVPDWRDDQVDVRVAEEAVDWLRSDDGRPFFAYVASAAPHRPCVPPDFVAGTSRAGARGDSIHLVDWMVGRLVDALDEATLRQTVFIFTSDNGAPLIFPEDGDVVNYPPNGSWRGQKGDAFEGGHRVPLIWSGPGVPGGAVHSFPVSLLDLMPTLAAIVGTQGGMGDVDGVEVRFTEATESGTSPDRVFGVQAFDGRLALRAGRYKAIYGSGSGGFSDPVGVPCGPGDSLGQLYDLDADPAETQNLWRTRAGTVRELHRRYSSVTGYDPSIWS